MKVEFNKHFGFEAKVEEEDLVNGIEIMRLMQHPGWKILENYYLEIREELISKGKLGVLVKDAAQKEGNIFAILLGYDSFRNLPAQFVAEVDKKIKQKQEEQANDEQ